MIHIDLEDKSPDPAWVAEADRLTAELVQLNEEGRIEERDALIDRNAKLWGKLKDWLGELSHHKCWYSEARDCASYWHVDHFRPKKDAKDIDGKSDGGYWWLAFKWQNYRFAGSALNTPKSTKFPVRNGTTRISGPTQDENDEHPYLLDPTCEADPGLLSFDEQGKAIPGDPEGEWNRSRAEVSIDILNLNFDALVRGRQVLWEECDRRVNLALNLMSDIQARPSVTAKTRLRDTVRELRRFVATNAQFSAVATTCIRSQGVDWLADQVLRH